MGLKWLQLLLLWVTIFHATNFPNELLQRDSIKLSPGSYNIHFYYQSGLVMQKIHARARIYRQQLSKRLHLGIKSQDIMTNS